MSSQQLAFLCKHFFAMVSNMCRTENMFLTFTSHIADVTLKLTPAFFTCMQIGVWRCTHVCDGVWRCLKERNVTWNQWCWKEHECSQSLIAWLSESWNRRHGSTLREYGVQERRQTYAYKTLSWSWVCWPKYSPSLCMDTCNYPVTLFQNEPRRRRIWDNCHKVARWQVHLATLEVQSLLLHKEYQGLYCQWWKN